MRQRWTVRVVAAAALVVVPVLALSGAAVAQQPQIIAAAPMVLPSCAGSGVGAAIDHGIGGSRSTDTPLQIADRWAAALRMHARYPHLDREIVRRSATGATVAFAAGDGRVVAVLEYDNQPGIGWLLTSLERCG